MNFNRPGFQALIKEVEAGNVGTLIVKDMSRLGRNYLQVGFYTEILFPQKDVRFLAINNSIDSNNASDNDFAPFLNLRGGFKKTIMEYIAGKYLDLVPLYDEIYNKHNRSYFEALEVKAEEMAKKYDCPFVDNEMPYGRVPQGHPVIVDYFYHEEIRGTENTGKRNR